jgi:hypothetical protein
MISKLYVFSVAKYWCLHQCAPVPFIFSFMRKKKQNLENNYGCNLLHASPCRVWDLLGVERDTIYSWLTWWFQSCEQKKRLTIISNLYFFVYVRLIMIRSCSTMFSRMEKNKKKSKEILGKLRFPWNIPNNICGCCLCTCFLFGSNWFLKYFYLKIY